MDIQKKQLIILCLSFLPLSVAAQEWSKRDSLKLQQLLDSEQEIKINRKLIEETEQGTYSPKPFMDVDVTLPTVKSPAILSKPFINTHNILYKPSSSTFLPPYSLWRIHKNLILHSKSNFAESPNSFHIETLIDYKISKKWSLTIYGTQNLNTRKHCGVPSEVEPTQLGSHVVLKISKNWKIKTGMQYQYNALQNRWEWIPQVSVSYEW